MQGTPPQSLAEECSAWQHPILIQRLPRKCDDSDCKFAHGEEELRAWHPGGKRRVILTSASYTALVHKWCRLHKAAFHPHAHVPMFLQGLSAMSDCRMTGNCFVVLVRNSPKACNGTALSLKASNICFKTVGAPRCAVQKEISVCKGPAGTSKSIDAD